MAKLLLNAAAAGKKPRLMFQDEARFGRMSRPRRCWAPAGTRPMMSNGYEREFTYVYGAVSPMEGTMDYRLCSKMNTEEMGIFLREVSVKYPEEYLLMVVDGASSHKAKALEVLTNIALIPLPGYSPQLNPQENVWDEIREKNFPNRVYESMEAVRAKLVEGLAKFASETTANAANQLAFPYSECRPLYANGVTSLRWGCRSGGYPRRHGVNFEPQRGSDRQVSGAATPRTTTFLKRRNHVVVQ